MTRKIDLIYFSASSASIHWHSGASHPASLAVKELHETVTKVVNTTNAEWIFFWDYSLGQPDMELVEQLSSNPADVFHGGLKLGTRGLPDVLNYVHPTWMYNADGPEEITHSNFRLSFRACLVRTSVLKKIGVFSTVYTTLEMAGIAYGYQILKQGGVIRYCADLVRNAAYPGIDIPLEDEWIFARQFFTKKWQRWILFNKPGFFENLAAWSRTKNIKPVNIAPCLHPSAKTNAPVQLKTVSVLAPTLDRYSYLKEELRELNEQTILPHEVLITDQTDKELRQYIDLDKYPRLTIKYFPQDEKGQCLAWNKLIDEATGEYI
ncbi:MAG TPA: glycosyltransferase family A protein, partial [Flavipsychrobacter sp.]|nr:glycosyltransferase family A protein [Flavipsychrobacter sp.]